MGVAPAANAAKYKNIRISVSSWLELQRLGSKGMSFDDIVHGLVTHFLKTANMKGSNSLRAPTGQSGGELPLLQQHQPIHGEEEVVKALEEEPTTTVTTEEAIAAVTPSSNEDNGKPLQSKPKSSGRPRKAGNKKSSSAPQSSKKKQQQQQSKPTKRKGPGRPKGSKNKSKK